MVTMLFQRPSQRLVYRRRVFVDGAGGQRAYWMAGWVERVGEGEMQSIAFVDEEGHVIVGAWQPGHWLFDSVKFTPEEEGEHHGVAK